MLDKQGSPDGLAHDGLAHDGLAHDGWATGTGATIAGRPSARAKPRPPHALSKSLQPGTTASTSPHRSQTTHSPAQQSEAALNRVLLGDELTRAHGFSALIAGVSFGVLCVLPLLTGDPLAKQLCAAALALISAGSVLTWRATPPDQTYASGRMRAYGFTIATAVLMSSTTSACSRPRS